jgi:hypothetical protein
MEIFQPAYLNLLSPGLTTMTLFCFSRIIFRIHLIQFPDFNTSDIEELSEHRQ